MSLHKRIHPNSPHYDLLIEELKKFDSGDYGERYIRELLEQEFGDAFCHFANYRLGSREIDLLSVTNRACFLFEVKNIRGRVQLTHHPPQLIRTIEEGKVDVFKSPISQLEMNAMKLQQFWQENNIDLPIYAAVVFAFHNAYITTESQQLPIVIGRDVCRFIVKHIHPEGPPNVKVTQLLTLHAKRQQYLPKLAKFKLDASNFLTGVFCPNCDYLPMKRMSYTWHCPKCQTKDRNAHIAALQHYYELISNKITNAECMKFLHLRNRHEAKRILQSHCVTSEGTTKGKIYTIQY